MSNKYEANSENMAKKKEKNKPKKKKVQKLSNIIKPENMELADWQKALRKQIAIQERFVISQNTQTDEPGCYSVLNLSWCQMQMELLFMHGFQGKPFGYLQAY